MPYEELNASMFWQRYREHIDKDFSVVLKTGIPVTTISTWKKRKAFPKADKAYKIATALGVTLEYLLTGKEENSK